MRSLKKQEGSLSWRARAIGSPIHGCSICIIAFNSLGERLLALRGFDIEDCQEPLFVRCIQQDVWLFQQPGVDLNQLSSDGATRMQCRIEEKGGTANETAADVSAHYLVHAAAVRTQATEDTHQGTWKEQVSSVSFSVHVTVAILLAC